MRTSVLVASLALLAVALLAPSSDAAFVKEVSQNQAQYANAASSANEDSESIRKVDAFGRVYAKDVSNQASAAKASSGNSENKSECYADDSGNYVSKKSASTNQAVSQSSNTSSKSAEVIAA